MGADRFYNNRFVTNSSKSHFAHFAPRDGRVYAADREMKSCSILLLLLLLPAFHVIYHPQPPESLAAAAVHDCA